MMLEMEDGRGSSQKESLLDEPFHETVALAPLNVRLGFIRKVYGILSMQLLMTVIVSAFCMYNEAVKGWYLCGSTIYWVVFLNKFERKEAESKGWGGEH